VTDMASFPRPPADEVRGGGSVAKVPGGYIAPSQAGGSPSPDVMAALSYGLEMAHCGAMLVSEGAHLQLANRKAIEMLQKRDGISLIRAALVAERPSEMRLLHRLLQEAILSPECGEPRESPFTVERKYAHSCLVVRVAPGPGLECWPAPEQRTALLKVYDHDPGLTVDEHALTSIYGLTRGEAALAAKLVQGKSIETASDELFISAHTARTHLKRIFMKTDTHRQSELILRMLITVL